MNKYPIFIISKGRWESRLTVKTLEMMNINYKIVIEQQEFDNYNKYIDKEKILILPKEKYWNEYNTCDEYGLSKSPGSGPARNFVWDYAQKMGVKRHWIMDDNIKYFYKLHNNIRIKCKSGKLFRIMEDFVDKFDNIALAGPYYYFFVIDTYKYKPFLLNNRVFSCLLIKNDIPFRWRARYNEDVDLSLRVLKAGYCTISFYAYLQGKQRTQTMKGGNTDELYKKGTLEKSKMIVNLHPDLCKLTKKYGRWHHSVNYKKYANNKLLKSKDYDKIDISKYKYKLITNEKT